MSLRDDLIQQVTDIFKYQWNERNGRTVPAAEDLTLTNTAVRLDGTVLYADISGSTGLVDGYKNYFAAEVYKSFLFCSAKVIKNRGGVITAYDGDRVMAVFIGKSKNSDAARAALEINYVRQEIINPAIRRQYSGNKFYLQHTVGIDTSQLYVARTGVRGANDLVWVGRAANHAAKLCELSAEYPTRITQEVFNRLNGGSKYGGDPRRLMWNSATWNTMGRKIYRSSWHWAI